MFRNLKKFLQKNKFLIVLFFAALFFAMLGVIGGISKMVNYQKMFGLAIFNVLWFIISFLRRAFKEKKLEKEARHSAEFKSEYKKCIKIYPQYEIFTEMVNANLAEMGKNPAKVLSSTWVLLLDIWMSVLCKDKEEITDCEVAAAIMHALNIPGGDPARVMLIYRCVENMLVKPRVYSIQRENGKIVKLNLVGYGYMSEHIRSYEERLGKDEFKNLLVNAINQREMYDSAKHTLAEIFKNVNLAS